MENREQTPMRPSRRVGTFTFGVTLVIFGLWMLASLLLPEADLLWLLKLSPLVLVLLGAEVLLAARNSSAVKYDWVGMLLCTVIVLTALSLFAAAWWVMHMPEGVLGAAAWAMIYRFIFNNDFGVLNNIIRGVNPGFDVQWFYQSPWAFWAVTLTWLFYAVIVTLVVLGDLMNIPQELGEAARLDGATGWQFIRYIEPNAHCAKLLPIGEHTERTGDDVFLPNRI